MKKLFSILLVFAMLVPSLIACQNTEQPADTTADSVSDSVSDSETETTAPEEAKPDLPDVTYDGAAYDILAAAEQWIKFYDVDAEEIAADIVNQAVYDRNTAIESQFDTTIEYIPFNGYSAGISLVGTALQDAISGSATYDLVVGSSSYITPHITPGYFADLNDADYQYINYTAPWYYKYVTEQLEINGSQYLASGSFGISTLGSCLVTFFNKQVLEDNNLDDMYSLVRENKWTLDKMMEMSDSVKKDLNSDGAFTFEHDAFGLVSRWDYVGTLPNSFGYYFFNRSADNKISMTGVTDKLIDINEQLYKILHADYYFDGYSIDSAPNKHTTALFSNNRALFMMLGLSQAADSVMRDMGDYGIVPLPLYNEEQDHYVNFTVPDVFGVPSYVEDIDFSCIIAEALNYESLKLTTPAYLENALKEKYSRDPDTAEMVDTVIENATTDFAYLYLRIFGQDLFYTTGKQENYASWAASNLPAYEAKLVELLESIDKLQTAKGQ